MSTRQNIKSGLKGPRPRTPVDEQYQIHSLMQDISLSDPKVKRMVADAVSIVDKGNEKKKWSKRGRRRDIQSPLATTSTEAIDTEEGMEFSKKVASKLETKKAREGILALIQDIEGTEKPVVEERPESILVMEPGDKRVVITVSCAICYTHL